MIIRKHFPERTAFRLGFRVSSDGQIVTKPNGQPQKLQLDRGYYSFSVPCKERNAPCHVHRLQAYQKFGEQIYVDGLQIRHLDNNPGNNEQSNIGIGNQSQNMLDRPRETRMWIASRANLKHDHEAIRAHYAACRSYGATKLAFKLSSSGTLHYILNGRTAPHPPLAGRRSGVTPAD